MKRIFMIAGIALLIIILPYGMAKGQDKKSEQKIKIIINDGSGNKVVMDTIFKDRPAPDSLNLRDGSTVYIKHHGDDADSGNHKGKEHFYVTYSSGGKDNGKEIEEVTVISSDSTHFTVTGDSDNIMVHHKHRLNEGKDNIRYKVIIRDSKDQGDKEEYVYINKGKDDEENIDNGNNIYISDDDKDSAVEKTRFVIARDGIVVTIEGTDEIRAKELAKVIEEKLGVNREGTGKKESVNAESKKTVKK
jgi:hypothetical protein